MTKQVEPNLLGQRLKREGSKQGLPLLYVFRKTILQTNLKRKTILQTNLKQKVRLILTKIN